MKKVLRMATMLVVLIYCMVTTGLTVEAEETVVKGDFILPVAQITSADEIPEGFTALYDASDLQKIVDNPSGRYILMADVSLAEFDGLQSIGFTGVLYGNGHSLTDMYTEGFAHPRYELNKGLFCWIRDAEIRDLRVQGSMYLASSGVEGGAAYMGGIAGYVFGSSLITNCVTDVDMTYDEDEMDMFYDIGCAFGGVAGWLEYSSGASISYCRNVSNMRVLRCGGGIVGRIMSYSEGSAAEPTVYACINSGTLFTQYETAGGIAGYIQNSGDSIVIDSCANHGEVTGCWNVGGILGEASEDGARVEVRDCLNAGEIVGTDAPVVCVGGIVGAGNCYVTTCVNAGEFRANIPSGIHTEISEDHLKGCYYLDNAQGAMCRTSGEKITDGMLTAEQMLKEESFPALDLANQWILDPLATGWPHPYPRALLGERNVFEPRWPLDDGNNFVVTLNYYNSMTIRGSHAHSCQGSNFNGMDVSVREQPVYAVEDGVVDVSTEVAWTSFGNYIRIRHTVADADGNERYIYSLYAHMLDRNTTDADGNPVQLKAGDFVQKGQRIGTSGYSLSSSGSQSWHLHFEIFEADANGSNKVAGSLFSVYSDADIQYASSCYSANTTYGAGNAFSKEFLEYMDGHYVKSGDRYVRNEGDSAPAVAGFTDGLTKVEPPE